MFKEIFETTLMQMVVLMLFIAIGFVLVKTKVLNKTSIKTLSKLVSTVFLPLVLVKSFMTSFTIENISASGAVLILSVCVAAGTTFLGLLLGKLIIKNDDFLKKMYQYGLIYSNFTYMGIPIVQAIDENYLIYYLIFTIIPQFVFTLWALPNLLIPVEYQANDTESSVFKKYLKRLFNPIFIGLLIGAILGLTGLGLKISTNVKFLWDVIAGGAACMSPIAMILTGVVIASYDIVKCLKDFRIYIISVLRLIAIPVAFGLAFLLVAYLGKKLSIFTLNDNDYIILLTCIITYTSMPLGLNTVIIPSSFDKDVIDCAGMSLVSHILGIITIPIIFAMFLS